jgi:anti-sigma factor RsiW
MITCQELVDGLYEYLSDELWPPKRAECDLHLTRCAACAAYLRSYRETVDLAKAAYDPSDAPEMPESLVQSILAKVAPRPAIRREQRGVG